MFHRPPHAGSAEHLLAEGHALRRLARSLVGGDGDDVAQAAYAAVLAHPATAREPGAWLMGSVRHLAAMWRRTDRRRRARELAVAHDETDNRSDPAMIAAQAEVADHVAAAVRALDEPFRSMIVLRYWRGLLPEQIAAELGVPRNTVRSRLQRGLERLRAQLDAKYDEPARWRSALVLFSGKPQAAASGTLVALGAFMNAKLLLGTVALLVAAVLVVPFCLAEPSAVAPMQAPHGASVSAVVARVDSTTSNERHAAPVPEPMPSPTAAAAPVQPDAVVPWLVRFRVVDEADRSVDGASITIHAVRPGGASGGRDSLLCELRTDPDGRASATIDCKNVRATASKGGSRTGDVQLSRTFNPPETKFVLELPVQLRGRVLGADGAPAAGAVVTARVNGGSSLQHGPSLEPDPVVADADGRFTFAVTRHARYGLRATIAEVNTFVVSVRVGIADPPEVVLMFPGAITLRGVVLAPNGERIPGATVRAWREHHVGDPRQDPDDYERAGALTDEQGRFVIDVQRHARYQLVASAQDLANSAALWVETTAARPHADAELVLQDFATIAGTVWRSDREAFAGVRVVARLDDPNPGVLAVASPENLFSVSEPVKTGADGRFTLRVHPGTHWQVSAFPRPGNGQFKFTIDDVVPGRTDVDFTIRDHDLDGCVVRGVVVIAADGTPASAFDVSIRPFVDGKAGDPSGVAARVEGNHFEVTLPRDKTWVLDVSPRITTSFDTPFAPLRVGPFTTTRETVQLDVRLLAWGDLPVCTVRADGSAMQGLFASAWPGQPIGNVMHGPRRLDGEGRAVLRCTPGPNKLRVTDGKQTLHEQEVLITPGLNPEVIVRLPK